MDEVYMDIPAVRGISKTFGDISSTLKQVANTLEALSNILKGTAFIGLVGGWALAAIIDRVKPYIENISQKSGELSKDLTASVNAFERGDAQGATRFY
jgi:hypothetical protein